VVLLFVEAALFFPFSHCSALRGRFSGGTEDREIEPSRRGGRQRKFRPDG